MTKQKKIGSSYLIVSTLGENNPNALLLITEQIAESHCSIVECKASHLGEHLAGYFLLKGKWNQIAKAESILTHYAKTNAPLDIKLSRTSFEKINNQVMRYIVYAIALDEPSLVNQITEFFTNQNVTIHELNTHTYKARITEIPMFSLTMQISVATDFHIADLRDAFLTFADSLNIDAIMEPDK